MKISETLFPCGEIFTSISTHHPTLPPINPHSHNSRDLFLTLSLKKDVQQRPKYDVLLDHPFIKQMEELKIDVAAWYQDICDREQAQKA